MDALSMIQIVLGEFYDKLVLVKDLVRRDVKFPEAPSKIKVAIGMRRAGKTYLLYRKILQMLEEGIDKKSILYINFEDDRFIPLDQQKLAKLVDAFYSFYPENHDRRCYLFFDEIQSVEDWPTVIRRLHDSKNVEIFLTGSSAKLLSKEIATNLRGRSLAVEVWPYSFSEFMRAKNTIIDSSLYDQKTQDKLGLIFQQYLLEGGFPEVTSFNPDDRRQTLQEYLDVVIYRDIIERHAIKNPSVIKYMIVAMIHNAGKMFSINKFYQDLKSQGYQIGKDSLYEYADYIEDAYLAFFVEVYDPSIRKVQNNPKKIYAIDPGMIRALTMEYERDLGRVFENIIYLDLKRLGHEVQYYLTKERYEVDFIVKASSGKRKLFQVALELEDEKTKKREERALESAVKELQIEGEIVTLDSYLRKGIQF